MGLAHKAPFQGTLKHFGVTDTAVKIFRELNPGLDRTTYRTDKDLSFVLDEWAWDSWQGGLFENIIDGGKPSILVDLRGRSDDLWALVRDNDQPGKGRPNRTIITVLHTRQVEERKATGAWSEHKNSPGKPMLGLREKLAEKVVSIVQDAAAETATSTETVRAAQLLEKHKLVWSEWDEQETEILREQEFDSKQEAADFATELLNDDELDIDPKDIQLLKLVLVPTWVPVKTAKIKFEA
jgi:hypothetical protein